jgi:D-alanyl-D-alanine carboxypeptidase
MSTGTHSKQPGRRCLIGAALVVFSTAFLTPGSFAVDGSRAPDAINSARLQDRLDHVVASGPPGATLLARNQRRTVRLASGVSEVETGRTLLRDDRFRIGSLTKSYTATVILQLAEDQRLSLDEAVETYVPGLVPGGQDISVRQLLNHTSGLFEYEDDARVLKPYLAGDLSHVTTPRRLVRIAVSHPPLFAPGTKYSYSNTNYIVAGLIIEAVTDHTLESEIRRGIISPLHLAATTTPNNGTLHGAFAHGYYVFGSPPATDITQLYPFSWAAGAIVSNTLDVAKYYRALLRGRLLEPGSLRAMKTVVPIPKAEGGGGYGLGLIRFHTPCGPAWGHNGNQPGYQAVALTRSDGKHQAVLMINLDPSALSETAVNTLETLVKDAYCLGAYS